MAKIKLQKLRHSYMPSAVSDEDYALKQIDLTFEDGGAYALLGPSGCGKTTLLNIISGLLKPSEGKVVFDDNDVTNTPTMARQIAQVFQFPVVYDTMTVFDNLAFPLRNRGVCESKVITRVTEIAQMLELEASLKQRASGLTADGKQKISLGRGLVREDVNVIMFDEPLTVIDPHLKWELRSKLKELHQEVGVTMIYVTHDQTEALTFADQVFVMHEGAVVQQGTPVELFEKPKHTFVGHFIGSPGMNVLQCEVRNGAAMFAGNEVGRVSNSDSDSNSDSNSDSDANGWSTVELGVRPEFVTFSSDGVPVEITKVDDLGRYQIVSAKHQEHRIKMIVGEGVQVPAENARVAFDSNHARIYVDGWLQD